MEFTDLIPLPLTKNTCRTCLAETEDNFMNLQDIIDYDMKSIKIGDVLSFLGCVEEFKDDNWPQSICELCTSNAITSYHFKVTSQRAAETLSHLISHPSPNIPDIDSIDINVILQDHEYELPFLTHPSALNSEANLMQDLTITPVPVQQTVPVASRHTGKVREAVYICSICSNSFTTTYGLNYHMERHKCVKRKLCQVCGKSFSSIGGLRQHLLSHRGARFTCTTCCKRYKSKQTLQDHVRIAHTNNRYAFTCDVCDKLFTAKSSLVSHLQTHSVNRDLFACTMCPKKYTKNKYLRAHLEHHTAEGQNKKYSCNYFGCERKFATKNSLVLHASYSHTNERPHQCSVCSKSFVTIYSLNKHKDVHNNTDCHFCGQKLLNKRLLRLHLRDHKKLN